MFLLNFFIYTNTYNMNINYTQCIARTKTQMLVPCTCKRKYHIFGYRDGDEKVQTRGIDSCSSYSDVYIEITGQEKIYEKFPKNKKKLLVNLLVKTTV